jgi:cytochrome c oxidase subunit 1
MFGGAASAFFAGLHYWLPKMFGRMHAEKPAWIGIVLYLVGFNLTYFPLFLAGIAGMPRRYAGYLPEFQSLHVASTVGTWLMVPGLLTMFGNLLWSVRHGRIAPADPWGGQTLEWKIASPPPTENFVGEPSLATHAYDYPEEVAP